MNGLDTSDSTNNLNGSGESQPTNGDVMTNIKVAPPSTEDQSDSCAVCRARHVRPRQRLLKAGDDDNTNDAADSSTINVVYEPDIESFVSACIPGVSFPAGGGSEGENGTQQTRKHLQRANMVRKRSLPMLTHIAATSLGAAERKRRKEEQERLQLLAEEAAKKIADANNFMLEEEGDDNEIDREESARRSGTDPSMSQSTKDVTSDINQRDKQQESGDIAKSKATTTVTLEKGSNILMPPLLASFLDSLKKCPR